MLFDREAVLTRLIALDERTVNEIALGAHRPANELRALSEELVDGLRVDRLVLHARQHERSDDGSAHRQPDRGKHAAPAPVLGLDVVCVAAPGRGRYSGGIERVRLGHGSAKG
jgi:hypothetical protein